MADGEADSIALRERATPLTLLAPLPMTSASFRLLVPVVLATFGLVFLASSCSSTQGAASSSVDAGTEVTWLEASPSLARDIEVKSLEVSQMTVQDDFIRLSDWFQSVGEPAYPRLLEMAASSNDAERTFALSVIAAQRDPRLLSPLREAVPMSSIAKQQHRYEMARALLMLGDHAGIPILIDGLESPSRGARAQSITALNRGTHAGIPYNAAASDQERAESVAAWRQWWAELDQDDLLAR